MPPLTAADFPMRKARLAELPHLPELERLAGRRFARLAFLPQIPEDLTPLDALEAALARGHVWVVENPGGQGIVGFAYAAPLDGALLLEEIDVLPEFGGRGIGTGLVQHIARQAVLEGYPALTLTTFRDVPWNAPFYARLGFRIVPEAQWTPGLRRAVADEARRGLPIQLRVVMRRDLAP